MKTNYSARITHLKQEGAYAVLAKANQLESSGRDIIHFEIGQPDFGTFRNICLSGVRAIRQGKTRYTPPAGIQALRAAIASDAGERRGIQVHPDEVVVSPGGKPNLFFPTLALIDSGDEVIYPNPGFPTYEAMIKVAGGIPVPVPLIEEKRFSIDLDVFEKKVTDRTRLIILNSPSNPTGGIIPYADLKHIAEIAKKKNIWVMSDEIYARFAYDGFKVPSIASFPDMKQQTIIVDGFSKTYSMTGWRLGYGIMPIELAKRMELLLTHSVGSTAQFTQIAGLEALTGPQIAVENMVVEFQRRRDLMVDGLNSLPGFHCEKPQGAFYAFPNISGTGISSIELADSLLVNAGVALLPGSAFGDFGKDHLRLSYATSMENIQKGIERIRKML